MVSHKAPPTPKIKVATLPTYANKCHSTPCIKDSPVVEPHKVYNLVRKVDSQQAPRASFARDSKVASPEVKRVISDLDRWTSSNPVNRETFARDIKVAFPEANRGITDLD